MSLRVRKIRKLFPGCISECDNPTGLSYYPTVETLANMLQQGDVLSGSSGNIVGGMVISNKSVTEIENVAACPTVNCNNATQGDNHVHGTGFGYAKIGSAKIEEKIGSTWGELVVTQWTDTQITVSAGLNGSEYRVTNLCGNSDTALIEPLP